MAAATTIKNQDDDQDDDDDDDENNNDSNKRKANGVLRRWHRFRPQRAFKHRVDRQTNGQPNLDTDGQADGYQSQKSQSQVNKVGTGLDIC